MDLKTFVSETLIQIAEGVAEAQEPVAKVGGIVNPFNTQSDSSNEKNLQVKNDDENHLTVRRVLFDVAVTVASETDASGGGKINVLSLKMGGDVSKNTSNEMVTKINFAVNLALPAYNAAPNTLSNKKNE